MIRVYQVKNAQEELVIITHSRITATAAVGHTLTRRGVIQGSPSPLPPSTAYSRVGRQTYAGGSQLELPSVEEDPPVLDCKPRFCMWWDWERPRQMEEACGCGAVHQGQHATEGMWASASQDRRWCRMQSSPAFQGFQLFDFSLTPRGYLDRNSFPSNPTC